MRERDLAMLLIQMGVDSGIDVERAAEELAAASLPTYVDMRAFRLSLIEEVEAQMRAQMEQRLQLMRRRLEVDGASASTRTSQRQAQRSQPEMPAQVPAAPQAVPAQAAVQANQVTEIAPAPRKGAAEAAPQLADIEQLEGGQIVPSTAEEEDIPTDATMVWTTRHG